MLDNEAALDQAMELGASYPRGPIAWGRTIGFDLVLDVLEHLRRVFGEKRYRPADWLRQRARALPRTHRATERNRRSTRMYATHAQ